MKQLLTIMLVSLFLLSCKKDYQSPVPDTTGWDLFNDASAATLSTTTKNAMEGVYNLEAGAETFGQLAAIKWSYVIKSGDTLYHVSGFFGKDIAYFICEGKKLNGEILLNGYWRKMVSTETGIMRITINAANGSANLLAPNPVVTKGSIIMEGVYGNGSETPMNPITLSYDRTLNSSRPNFKIMAHRSGGRTSDLLPVSENSVEMILKTPEFGSTGIEIDVRYTKDGIPIIYHDDNINLRETQKSGLVGPITNYTYDQLSTFVRLIHGEKIPTLRQALDAVVYQTQLSFVWLDSKFNGAADSVRAIQKEYLAKAAANGRLLQIVIGIPTKTEFDNFLALPNYKNIPSLCELNTDAVEYCNSVVWAPRFTEGTQNEKVALMHAQGRLAFVWTLDVPEFITKFIKEGNFDAILSNFPSCVAYNYYVQQ
ncbi:MAG: glycerophosphodiester phosphodiesterase [Ferruginibacter sp.]